MPEIVDLTGDSPPPQERKAAAGGKKRPRDSEQPANLTNIDDVDGGGNNEEEQQRRAIMQFARNATRVQNTAASIAGMSPSRAIASAFATRATAPGSSTDPARGDTARNRIMEHAAKVNAERRQQQQQPSLDIDNPSGDPKTSSTAGNNFLAQLHAERMARRGTRYSPQPPPSQPGTSTGAWARRPSASTGAPSAPGSVPSLSILTYNVWFRMDVALETRMKGISQEITKASPDFICFQEMTPLIYQILSELPWWRNYRSYPSAYEVGMQARYFTVILARTGRQGYEIGKFASIPFENSIMMRDLKVVTLKAAGGATLAIATSHLESPTSAKELYSAPRIEQCKQSVEVLEKTRHDVVFLGDMNWNEKNDGPPPLPTGWVDAWTAKYPGDPGFTYDAQENAMLKKGYWTPLRLRLDRAFCKLKNWELEDVQIVGTKVVGGVERFEGRPILPSDHFGLLVKLRGKAV